MATIISSSVPPGDIAPGCPTKARRTGLKAAKLLPYQGPSGGLRDRRHSRIIDRENPKILQYTAPAKSNAPLPGIRNPGGGVYKMG